MNVSDYDLMKYIEQLTDDFERHTQNIEELRLEIEDLKSQISITPFSFRTYTKENRLLENKLKELQDRFSYQIKLFEKADYSNEIGRLKEELENYNERIKQEIISNPNYIDKLEKDIQQISDELTSMIDTFIYKADFYEYLVQYKQYGDAKDEIKDLLKYKEYEIIKSNLEESLYNLTGTNEYEEVKQEYSKIMKLLTIYERKVFELESAKELSKQVAQNKHEKNMNIKDRIKAAKSTIAAKEDKSPSLSQSLDLGKSKSH